MLDSQVEPQAVQINLNEVTTALQTNPEFFIQFFLPDLEFDVPQFHIDIFKIMVNENVRKLALAIPRGHAKTTLAKLAVVYYFLFTSYRFIVYVSNTAEVAQAACRDIIAFITSPNFIAVFGRVEFEMERTGDGFYIFKLGKKRCILRALGAGQQVRGINVDNERPEMGVVDDLEDDDNTATEQLRIKLRNWVYGPFVKAFNKWKSKILWLGNMLSNLSILKHLCDDNDWHSIRLGCLLSNGQPLWPDLWPIEEIKKDFIAYKKLNLTARWMAEMMNLPMPEGGALINADEILYRPSVVPGDIQFGFITIDPAISKKSTADNTAIAVHGIIDSTWQVVEYYTGKLDPKQTYQVAITLALKWKISTIGIESVAYQASLMFMFDMFMKTDLIEGIEVVALKASGRKTERISSWCGAIKAKQYALTEGEIVATQQLLNYDPAKDENDDDLIDACAYGLQMISDYAGQIFAVKDGWLPPKISLTIEHCAH